RPFSTTAPASSVSYHRNSPLNRKSWGTYEELSQTESSKSEQASWRRGLAQRPS
ncbi:hypothetical protein PO909_004600, partial [Leuciscus waleckii]